MKVMALNSACTKFNAHHTINNLCELAKLYKLVDIISGGVVLNVKCIGWQVEGQTAYFNNRMGRGVLFFNKISHKETLRSTL